MDINMLEALAQGLWVKVAADREIASLLRKQESFTDADERYWALLSSASEKVNAIDAMPPANSVDEYERRHAALLRLHQLRFEIDEPAAPVGATPNVRRVAGKNTRDNVLAAVSEDAYRRALNPESGHSAWHQLIVLASSPNPPAPLVGFADGEVKYMAGEVIRCLGRRAFLARHRRAEKARRTL